MLRVHGVTDEMFDEIVDEDTKMAHRNEGGNP